MAQADVIIGNPPFLGDKKMRSELGDEYVNNLRILYEGSIPGQSDLVCYWFERTRTLIFVDHNIRAGLLSTNSIRNGVNQQVLKRVKTTGDIFLAWSDRSWVLDGAAVRVSIVAFDGGHEVTRTLDGMTVKRINSDLSSRTDVTGAASLEENSDICFLGMMKAGPFDIDNETAEKMLDAPTNPNGRTNHDVVKCRFGGQDITGRPRYGWIIDFGIDISEEDAALYELPFEYVKKYVKPIRDENRRPSLQKRWWIYGEPRRNLRHALKYLSRMIVTPEVAKHRVFAFLPTTVVPDHKLHVVARQDDYFFGTLHSRIHEVWSLALCSWMGVGNDPSYSSSRIFETFPFPWSPGKEPVDDPRVQAIAQAAKELVEKRDAWLNPPGLGEAELKKRTLTNLYNQRPTWLDLAHKKLDATVFAAYGWSKDLSDEEILERLLALNLERASDN